MSTPEAAVTPSPSLARATALMTAGSGVSRGLGFARALLMAAVLGPTFFGNTYTAANYVPNIVFELVAAGALSAILVPALVERLARDDQHDAEVLAGAVLGIVGLALGALAVVGMVTAPLIMRALTTAVRDPEVRRAQVNLGRIFLWCFLPQVLLYAWAMVATAALHARKQFTAPTLGPGVSSLIVMAVFAVFAAVAGHARTLHPPLAQTLLLGLGTTAGVAALALTPAIALARSGFSLRPRLEWHHPGLVQLRRLGAWAAVSLAATQVLNLAALVIGGRIEGGLVVWQLAFTYFLVPHALFSQSIFTALFPRLAEQAAVGDDEGRVRTMATGLRTTAFVALPATAAYVAGVHRGHARRVRARAPRLRRRPARHPLLLRPRRRPVARPRHAADRRHRRRRDDRVHCDGPGPVGHRRARRRPLARVLRGGARPPAPGGTAPRARARRRHRGLGVVYLLVQAARHAPELTRVRTMIARRAAA
jgi:putative peptidoglycan lipid II flippase